MPLSTPGNLKLRAVSNVIGGNGAGDSLVFPDRYNVLLGDDAGKESQGVNDNTFIGYEAGRDNDLGSENVFIGSGAGKQSVGAVNFANVYIGANAGGNNFNNIRSVVIGAHAANGGVSGDSVIIGEAAGLAGGSNVCIGRLAAQNAAGDNNVVVGWLAGENFDGDNNIFLGYAVASSLAATINNQLYIETQFFQDPPLIHGEFDNRNVGFNNKTYGDGRGMVSIGEAPIVPTSGPSSGGMLYVTSGALWYMSDLGNAVMIAPA